MLRICKHGVKAPKGGCPRCRRERDQRQLTRRKAKGQRTGTSAAYRKAREAALKRDGYRCTYVLASGLRCPVTGRGAVETHHRNGIATDDREDNLITLCPTHHQLLS